MRPREAASVRDHPVLGPVTAGTEPRFLRDLWYLAMPGKALRLGRTVHRHLLGEPLLIGRTGDGGAFALRDVCPHRAMPLSDGEFDGRELECPYHGWRFAADGTCTHIPSLAADQDLDLSRIHVRRYPCREVQGNVWVYIGDDAADIPEVPRIPEIGERDYQLARSVTFPCAVDHAVVGLMDPAHGPFVHRSWWWRSRASIHEKRKAFGPSHLGFTMLRHPPSSNSRAYRILGGTPETEISFQLPGIRIEHVHAGRHRFCGLTAVTPVDAHATVVHHVMYWTMPWLDLLKPLVARFARAFLEQDRAVVARQQAGLADAPALMLINDADVQARWYYQLKREFVRARAEERAFENPVKETVLRWRS